MQTALLERLRDDSAVPSHVALGHDAPVLSAILLPSITLAVWRRETPDAVAAAISKLDLALLEDIRIVVALPGHDDQLKRALREAGYDAAAISALSPEIASLAAHFAEIVDRRLVEVRLEIVETDACRKFHVDFVSVRLITTYSGSGTHWLDQAAADALAAGAALAELPIHQLDTGDIALFKGHSWAGERALVHRSPPIAGSGERRLVLVMNPGREPPKTI